MNPAASGAQSDKSQLNNFPRDVWNLTLARQLSGNNTYAEKARSQLANWFIVPATRMYPNLTSAQRIPGEKSVRDSGIPDGRMLIKIIDVVALLHNSGKLDNVSYRNIRQGYRDYYLWLTTSPQGFKEDKARNNHGTRDDVQTASIVW